MFGTANQLFEELVARFLMQPPLNLSAEEVRIWVEKKLSPIQIKICGVFKLWLEKYWIELMDDGCLDTIFSFASEPMMQAQDLLAIRLQEIVSKRVFRFKFRLIPIFMEKQRIKV
jgi:son of sevenless-like protein